MPVAGTARARSARAGFGPATGIFLLGAANQDTDEYDRHVIAHEFGHYLEHHFSRSDSIGGPHALTDQLDMRVAFGEAWGSAFAAMATGQPVYVDTHSAGQAHAFSFDLEQSPSRVNPNPGWFNEESLQALIFDLYDNGRDVPPARSRDRRRPRARLRADLGGAHERAAHDARADERVSVRPCAEGRAARRSTADRQLDDVAADRGGHRRLRHGPDQLRNTDAANAARGAADFNTVYDSMVVGATLPNVCSLDDYTSSLTGAENKLASRRFVRFTVTNPGRTRSRCARARR